MANLVADHPTPAQLRSFFEGKLAPDEFTSLEEHLAFCGSCCRVLENVPADSFVGRLKSAEQAAFATTADGCSATLLEVTGIPPELTNHPRYRVLSLIGQGGMGAVFKAEHRRMERLVALKVINPGLMKNLATVSRFQQEVRAAAKLAHPNIVTAHDADQAGGLHFLVMEYVDGKTLADLLTERGSLPIPEACEYVRQAAIGLQHLFEAGLIHRDIKPQNLMRGSNGTIKLLDCGLARFTDESAEPFCQSEIRDPQFDRGLTGAGTVMGTADYIAPEQITDARTADIRSDIYSLGCTFYHLLTGKPPFPDGTIAEKFERHAETAIALPEELPAELRSIVGKMTAKNPNDRYSTPAEVAEALTALGARSASKGPSAKRERPRRRSLIAAGLFALAALIIAAVVVIKIQTDKGEITITTDDENIEIVTKKGGDIVRIRDPKSGQTWELDTKKLTMRDLEHPDGLALEVPWRGKVTFKSSGGKVVVMAGPPGVPIAKEPEFKPLFNGMDLDGWKTDKANWAIKDGVIIADRAGELESERAVSKNFRLRMEIKLKRGTGVVRFRVPSVGERDWNAALMDNRLGMLDGMLHTGREIGQESTGLVKAIAKMDEWMELEITAQDQEATVRINGKQVMYLHNAKYTPAPGRIGLLIVETADPDNTEMHVRKIEIMELPPEPPASEPAFQPLFNGKDLTVWTSSADSYFVKKDGSLQANPVANEYAMLHTIRSYENYELRMLCKVDGAGQALAKNRGGVALHVTHPEGQSHPAYGIGISLTSGRDPDMKAHGLGDLGEVKSSQPTKGPIGGPGSWNELRAVCQDKKVTIYYNGEERWSCTLAPVSKGQIGLWSIDGETYFRDIEIKELPPTEPVFRTLFDGKDVSGWDMKLADNWRFEDNRLICRGAGGMLRPKKLDLREFHLRIEARHFGESAYLRLGPQLFQTPDKKSVTAHQHVLLSPVLISAAGSVGMEFGDKELTGGVAQKDRTKPGEWYTLDVIHEGRYVRTRINGEQVAEFVVTEPGALVGLGLLGFHQEDKNGELQIRKIEIRDLSDDAKTAKKRLQGYWTPVEAMRGAVGKAAAFSKEDLKAFALEFDKDKLKCELFPEATFHLRAPDRIAIKYRGPAQQMVSAEATYRLTHDILALNFENIDLPIGPAAPKDKDRRTPLHLALVRYHSELVPMFNGKNLHGFVNDRGNWTSQEDTLVGVRRANDMQEDLLFRPSMPNLRDFELEFQVRTQGQTPVGIFFRGGENKENVGLIANGPMLSIGGITPGGLWNRNVDQLWKVPPAEKIKAVKPDYFNHYVLRCVGKRVTVQINGVTMIDDDLDVPKMQPAGKLAWALLANGKAGTVTFREIRLRVLPQETKPTHTTDPIELAKRDNAADRLKRQNISKDSMAYAGGGNPDEAPPELVAVLGDIPKMYVNQMGDSALAFSPDGKYLAVAGESKIRLWDLATAKEAATWDTDRLSYHITFSPDGKLLANSTAYGINVHRVADGKSLYVLEAKAKTPRVHFSAFSPDGSLLAAPCGNDIRVWRVADGKELRVLGDQNPAPQAVLALIFSRDGSKLVAAGAGITVWETQTGLAIKHIFEGSLFSFLEWLPDGKTLAAANCFGGRPAHLPANYGVVCHVDLESGKKLKELLAPIPYNRPASLVLSPGARFVSLYEEDGNFVLTQPGFEPERKRIFRQSPPRDYSAKLPRSAAFSPDGRYLACSSNPDGIVLLYRLAEKGQLPELRASASTPSELADRPNAADALKHSDVPEIAKSFVGRGDPKNTPPELVAVLGDVRFRGLPRSRTMAYSADGKQIAEASGGLIRILDANSGRLIRQITSAHVPKKRLQFSQDGNYLLADSDQDNLGVIDAMTGKLLWESNYKVVTFCLDPDGNHVYLSSFDPKQIEKCNLRTGKSVQKWPMSEFARELAIGVEPQWVYVDAVGNVYSGRRDRNEVAVLMKESNHRGQRVVFSPDGKYFAVARISTPQAKHEITIYEAGGKLLHVLTGQAKDILAFSPDGATLTAVNIAGKTIVTRWKVATGEQIASHEFHDVFGDCHATLSPDTKTLALRFIDFPQIELWDTETGKHRYDGMNPQPFVDAFVWSPDGKQLAGFDKHGGYVWDVASGRISLGWHEGLSAVAYSPDGKMIALAREEAITLETNDGKTLHKLQGPKVALHRLAFSPNGKLLAAAGWSNNLWIWHTDTGKIAHILEQGNPSKAIAFSLDGRYLITSVGKTFHFKAWDLSTGKEHFDHHHELFAKAMVARPDGKTIAVFDNNACHVLLDARTGEITKPIEPPAEWDCLDMPGALSPDGDLVAVSAKNGSLVIWRPNDKLQRYRLIKLGLELSERIQAIRFSPDGRYVAVATVDGVICVLRIAERGKEPDLPNAVGKIADNPALELPPAPEVLPAPREHLGVQKLPPTPLDLAVKFPDNLYLVRAKLKEVDGRGPFGGPDKCRYAIEHLFAGPASLKELVFTYVPTLNFGSGPQTAYERVQLYGDFTAGSEGLWWIKIPGPRDVFAMDAKGGLIPVLDRREIDLHAIEGFPITRTDYHWHLSWEEGLKWAEKVEQVYRAKTTGERGKLLWQMIVKDRPHIARWAVATLAIGLSPEGRKDLRARAELLDLSVQESLLVDRVLARNAGKVNFYGEMMQMKENDEWLRAEARERLLRFCLQSNNEVEFELTCRRLSDAVRDHEIDFTLFAKVVDAQLNRGDKPSEDQQWSLGQTLLAMRFEMEPGAYPPVDPRQPKPFGLMTKEDRTKAITWLFDIVDKSTSTVLRNHAAAALKHYGPLSEVQKNKLPFDLGPNPTQADGTLAYRTAQNFAKDYATQKQVYVVGPFYLGGWLVPREKGWELPIKAKSLDAVVLLDKKSYWLPSKIVKSELLELRPELTRDPLLKELARVILKDKGLFYAVTMHGGHEMRLLVQVNNGHSYVRGFMPPVRHDPEPNEEAVRDVVQQFVKAHNAKDQPKLKELVSYPWCHGGKLWKVIDRKTTIELYPNPSMGTYGEGALGHPGWGPKFPEKLPETILHVMRLGDHFPALLTTGEDERAISDFMGGYLSDSAFVVFLGKLGEGGGVALLVRIDKDATKKKDIIKVVGTLTGLH